MNKKEINWYSASSLANLQICCANCFKKFDLTPFFDHDPSCCPLCGVECVFLDWAGKKIQIVMQNAPEEISGLIRWMQENLSELEYVKLITYLEELEKSVKTVNEV